MTSISTVGGGEIFIKRELYLKNVNYFLTVQSFDVMSDSRKNMYYNQKATSLFLCSTRIGRSENRQFSTKFDGTKFKFGITVEVLNFILNKQLDFPPCNIYKLH